MQSPSRARFAWGVLAFNLAVIVWGAFVRASGSGAGCGEHWPDCNGQIIPRDPSIATLIELTHRATSGLAFLLVVALLVVAYRARPIDASLRRSALASMLFMIVESGVGAALVLLRLVEDDTSVARAVVHGLHLANTFMLVGSLTAAAYFASGGARFTVRGHGALTVLAGTGALLLVLTGIAGAIAALGDTLFPAATLSEGFAADASPTAHFLVRLRVIHPIIAVATAIVLWLGAAFATTVRPSPRVRRASFLLASVLATQLALGLLDLWLLAPTWLQLVHLFAADLVWIAFLLFAAAILERRATATEEVAPGLA